LFLAKVLASDNEGEEIGESHLDREKQMISELLLISLMNFINFAPSIAPGGFDVTFQLLHFHYFEPALNVPLFTM